MEPITIQQVIDRIVRTVPGAPFAGTVDTVKLGDPSQPVTGIVTTFLATCEVIRRAIDLGANLIITHEPTFYNHLDGTGWLSEDPVYRAKCALIEQHHLVIWRCHDTWHSYQPDGILTGVLNTLGWQDYAAEPPIVVIPPMPLAALVQYVKQRLGAQVARVVGPPDMPCRTVAVMPGSPGGQMQIRTLGGACDVLLTGEINEWETCEYVRDACDRGFAKALIIAGHALSEQPGMAYLAEWLHDHISGVPIVHIPTGDPFRYE